MAWCPPLRNLRAGGHANDVGGGDPADGVHIHRKKPLQPLGAHWPAGRSCPGDGRLGYDSILGIYLAKDVFQSTTSILELRGCAMACGFADCRSVGLIFTEMLILR